MHAFPAIINVLSMYILYNRLARACFSFKKGYSYHTEYLAISNTFLLDWFIIGKYQFFIIDLFH